MDDSILGAIGGSIIAAAVLALVARRINQASGSSPTSTASS
jgi:hypothetical protein